LVAKSSDRIFQALLEKKFNQPPKIFNPMMDDGSIFTINLTTKFFKLLPKKIRLLLEEFSVFTQNIFLIINHKIFNWHKTLTIVSCFDCHKV
jgi:hypothetical protein